MQFYYYINTAYAIIIAGLLFCSLSLAFIKPGINLCNTIYGRQWFSTKRNLKTNTNIKGEPFVFHFR